MVLVALFLLALTGLAVAQDAAAAPKPSAGRPKIGLALSGGGARGVAHVGVLKALEDLRVPVDCIAGTSMGAIVGGFYASGLSPEEMEKWYRQADWHYLMADGIPRESESIRNKQRNFASNQGIPFRIRDDGLKLPAAFISGRNVMLTLRKLTVPARDIHDFDRLPIPYRAVATDIESGDLVVLREGDLVESMRASMSIPALFMPVKIGDRQLVDGGSANNLPISVVQQMGADVVIAVDVSEPLKKGQELDTAAAMALQVVNVLMRQQMKEEKARLGPADVLIRVEMEDMSAIDFVKAVQGIDEGYWETMKSRAALERYSLSPSAYRQYLAKQRVPREPSVSITFLKVRTPKGEFEHPVDRPFDFQAGDEDAPAELQNLVNDLGEMQAYDVKDYEVIKKDGDYGLLVTARERKDGHHELTFGFNFGYSSADEGDYNLLLAHRMRELNALGAEWSSYLSVGTTTRLDTEWYQPVDADRRFFVSLRGMAGNDFVDGRDASGEPLRFRQEDYFIGADVGMRLWQAGEFRVGYARGVTELHRRLGVPPDEPTDADRGWVHADIAIDTLDAPNFATQGIFGEVSVIASRDDLGDSENYTRLAGQLYKPITLGKNTIVPRVRGSVRLEGDRVPLYDQASLGGFLNLSGLTRGSLFGENTALAELVYYRKIKDLNPSSGRGLYAGFSAEMGEVWGHEKDFRWGDAVAGGSAFLGADTVLGGLYLGVGVAEGGDFSVYLQLGSLFGQGRHER